MFDVECCIHRCLRQSQYSLLSGAPGTGQKRPLRHGWHEDGAGASLQNTHQVNAFDKFLVLMSLGVGQLSLVGFGG